MKNKIPLAEIALVTLVGYGLARLTQSVPALNERKVLTRTLLYTAGYLVAAYMRPAGGYSLLAKRKNGADDTGDDE
jgi:hypothetical protein